MTLDTSTGLVILSSAIGSAKLIERILGPTADYIGVGVQDWTEKRVKNVARIFEYAERKLGKRIEVEGAVPPRVLKEILQEGSFCDDALAAEYFGGVLASSRSEISRDDRGAYFAGIVSRLTTYQLRTHFLLYSVLRNAFVGESIEINRPEGPGQLTAYLTRSSYSSAMEFSPKEDPLVIILHAFFGLLKEDLISRFISSTKEEFEKKYQTDVEENGIIFQPSALGVELFLWCHGRGELPVWQFLDSNVDLGSHPEFQIRSGFEPFRKQFPTSSPFSPKKRNASEGSSYNT